MSTTKVFQFEVVEEKQGQAEQNQSRLFVVTAERSEWSVTDKRGNSLPAQVHWRFYIRMDSEWIIPLKRLNATTFVDEETQERHFAAKVANPLPE